MGDIFGSVRLFPRTSDGQVASSAPIGGSYVMERAIGMANLNGHIYLTQRYPNEVIEISNSGAFVRSVATLSHTASGIVAATRKPPPGRGPACTVPP